MGDPTRGKVHIGTSGWSYDDWVGPFYPPGTQARDYLAAYATRFGVVEVDSTFYAMPAASAFDAWAERTPAGFQLAPKVPGVITHGAEGERANVAKVLLDDTGRLETFIERARRLGPKLACVVFQFPYFRVKEMAFEDFAGRLAKALERVPEDVRTAVEVRNKTWLRPEYTRLLEERGAAAVLIDHPYMPGPEEQVERGLVTSDFAYVRLLGDRHAIERKTTSWGATVEDKADRITRWGDAIREIVSRPKVRAVFAFANNHFAGHAPNSCRDLALRIEGGK